MYLGQESIESGGSYPLRLYCFFFLFYSRYTHTALLFCEVKTGISSLLTQWPLLYVVLTNLLKLSTRPSQDLFHFCVSRGTGTPMEGLTLSVFTLGFSLIKERTTYFGKLPTPTTLWTLNTRPKPSPRTLVERKGTSTSPPDVILYCGKDGSIREIHEGFYES